MTLRPNQASSNFYLSRPQNQKGRLMPHRKTKLPRYDKSQNLLCSRCSKYKPLKKFNKSNVEHKQYICNDCLIEYRKIRKPNINRLIDNIYSHQIHSKSEVCYTWDEFCKWVLSNKEFMNIYKIWIESDLNKKLTPTIIRKDSKKPFELNNLKVTTSYMGIINSGKTRQKKVIQFDLNNKEIARFQNARIAAQMLNYKYYSNIHEVCKGKKKTAAGFKWKYE